MHQSRLMSTQRLRDPKLKHKANRLNWAEGTLWNRYVNYIAFGACLTFLLSMWGYLLFRGDKIQKEKEETKERERKELADKNERYIRLLVTRHAIDGLRKIETDKMVEERRLRDEQRNLES